MSHSKCCRGFSFYVVGKRDTKNLSEFEIIDVTGDQYPNYIEGALLAPVIQTMKEAFVTIQLMHYSHF
jgi:hypothetical protein